MLLAFRDRLMTTGPSYASDAEIVGGGRTRGHPLERQQLIGRIRKKASNRRVNVDFTIEMLRELDAEALRAEHDARPIA